MSLSKTFSFHLVRTRQDSAVAQVTAPDLGTACFLALREPLHAAHWYTLDETKGFHIARAVQAGPEGLSDSRLMLSVPMEYQQPSSEGVKIYLHGGEIKDVQIQNTPVKFEIIELDKPTTDQGEG